MAKKPLALKKFRLVLSVLGLIRAHPLLLLLIAAITWGGYYFEVEIARPTLLYQGAPKAIDGKNINTWFRIFRNHGFILGYSDLRGNPLWVEYALSPVAENTPSLKRPSHFTTDWRGFNRVSHDSYSKSTYDRGHMAPNHAISVLYGQEGQLDSFLMTNITPQKPNLNQKLWQHLEAIELKSFTKLSHKVWVITGPVFTGSNKRLASDWKVEIPDAFFKIYLTEAKANKPSIAMAFLIPQDVTGKESLTKFVTSIDNIEKQTGLDFFNELDDKVEAGLEATIAPQPWNLSETGDKKSALPEPVVKVNVRKPWKAGYFKSRNSNILSLRTLFFTKSRLPF